MLFHSLFYFCFCISLAVLIISDYGQMKFYAVWLNQFINFMTKGYFLMTLWGVSLGVTLPDLVKHYKISD